MLLALSGLAAAGCGGEMKEEVPWIEMKDHWEGVSGGQVDAGEPPRIGWGESLTTVRWKGEVPKPPFELSLMARRVDGDGFFLCDYVPCPRGR